MNNEMIKVFLSSTFKDLAGYREKVEKTINSIDGYKCIAMENFGSRDAAAEDYCPNLVAECELFILLLGPTYGSCPRNSDKSYTEIEYDKAFNLNKPLLVFATSDEFPISQKLLNTLPPRDSDLAKKIRQQVGEKHIWDTFITPDELAGKIATAIRNWEQAQNRRQKEDALVKYLAYLIERNTDLNPRGIMQTVRQVSLQLDEVYVSLKAEREISGYQMSDKLSRSIHSDWERDEEFDDGIGLSSRSSLGSSMPERRIDQVDWAEAVRQHSRIVVLGDPGAGKTTLMRFLALQFARACRDDKSLVQDKEGNEYGEARFPIFFRVADYAEAFAANKNLKLRDFLAVPFANVDAPQETIADVFDDSLNRGNALVLLDGLDEIIDVCDRTQIASEIEDFIAAIDPRNRIIVTSRIAGYREAPLSGDYQHLALLDLERDQIAKFLNRWCHATEQFLSKDLSEEEVANNAKQEVDGILHAVDRNPGVKRLAVNPLLLTILALIYRNGSRLPNRRVELYELATKTLLEDWELARGIPSKKVVKEHEAAQFLWPLAYWLHTEKPRGLATEQEVKDKLAEFLARSRNVVPDDADVISAVNDFLDRVRKHTGVFVERAPKQFGFMHLTFEEYFAARELVRRPDKAAQRIYDVRHQPRWEEPILLAISFVSGAYPDLPGELIRTAILAESEEAQRMGFSRSPHEDVLHRDLLLAVRCIGDCVSVDTGLRQQVVERIVNFYLDVNGAGRYEYLRERILSLFDYFQGLASEDDAARLLIDALGDKEAYVQRVSIEALGVIKRKESAGYLLELLDDERAKVRTAAAEALGNMGGDKVVEELLKALGDERRRVRSAAAEALGKIGEDEAVNGLLRTLSDKSDDVASSAAAALGRIGGDKAVGGLLKALADKRDEVRGAAANALGRIGKKEAIDGLVHALSDGSQHVRYTASKALELMRSEDAVNGLLQALSNFGWEGSLIARALGKIGGDQVIEGVSRTITDERDLVRGLAASILGEVGGQKTIKLLLQLLGDRSEDVREMAAEALGKIGMSDAVDGLLQALNDDSQRVRRSAAEALGKIGSEEAADSLLQALRNDDEGVQLEAAGALGMIGREEGTDYLLHLLNDEQDWIRDEVVNALGNIGNEIAVGGMLQALKDEYSEVRRSVASNLVRLSRKRKRKWSPFFIAITTDALRVALDDLRNRDEGRWIDETYYPHIYDMLWDALCMLSTER